MARVSRLRFISPQLPSLTEHPPEGANWIHEEKHYGSPKSQHSQKCVEFRLLIQVTPHDNRLRPTPMVAHLRYRRLHRIGGDCAPPGQISAAPCLLINAPSDAHQSKKKPRNATLGASSPLRQHSKEEMIGIRRTSPYYIYC
jgi:hypothetical protein